MSKFLKSRFSTTNALKLRRVIEKEKRRVPFKRLAADETVVVVPLVVLFLLSLSILVVVVTDIFFFALKDDFKQPSSLFSHWMPPHVYNNKSFRLASSCALYIIRLILTRALRSTVVGVMLSLFPSATRRSGGSTLCEEEQSSSGRSWRDNLLFSQALNTKQRKNIAMSELQL